MSGRHQDINLRRRSCPAVASGLGITGGASGASLPETPVGSRRAQRAELRPSTPTTRGNPEKEGNMPTATKQSRAERSTYKELEKLEKEAQAAREKSSEIGREVRAVGQTLRPLLDRRAGLIKRDPALVDHTGAPVDDDNPVAQVDREIAELPDLNDLQARYEHSKRVTAVAEQKVRDFISQNQETVAAGFEPQAERAAAELKKASEEALAAANFYLASIRRAAGIRNATGRNRTPVPGEDQIGPLIKTLQALAEMPAPTVPPRPGHAVVEL